ncbi:hypothetical protein G7Z17_g13098 [Cylindrodendrum hubeiense]|uniref:Carboxylic ester hydrolase n=1 Tax=Cylindrodendrum hubeiense TaxID=595255 RepID=A0A9P5L9X5_9HYPO|nr:hypothetical protein G7Z17_g13098 [Cylindrodendrum hubeiense]
MLAYAEWANAAEPNSVCSAENIPYPEIPGLHILSLTANERKNYTLEPNPTIGVPIEPFTGLNFCNVSVVYTHLGWNDTIYVTTYVPTQNWNGRFQGNGGGGFVTGGGSLVEMTMVQSLILGFAVSTTDGGHSDNILEGVSYSNSWAFSSPGNINWPLLVDFASVALHDMAGIGKAITTSFYGTSPKFSYFYGGSTGGRQAHMIAQRYPEDFDGILGVCPAIYWTKFAFATIWPQMVMKEAGIYPRPCEFKALAAAAMKACDGLDGVVDGVISMPSRCRFDPHVLVGKKFDCAGVDAVFTSVAADAAQAAWTGPRSSTNEFQWYGYGKDSVMWGPMGPLATQCGDDGDCAGVWFPISSVWARYFVAKNPDLDLDTLTHEQWDDLFWASENEYGSIIGTADPDLSRFNRAGGKMITWHGLADQLIPVNGTVEYSNQVLKRDPKAHDYYRLFLAPGADHSFDTGITPDNPLKALIDWVEHGKAPETLRVSGPNAYGKEMKRDICEGLLASLLYVVFGGNDLLVRDDA